MSLLRHLPFAELNHRKHESTKGPVAGTQALDNFWKRLKKSMPKSLHARVATAVELCLQLQFRWIAQGDLWKAVARLIR